VENNLSQISMIQAMGIFGHALLPVFEASDDRDRDNRNYAAERILNWISPASKRASCSENAISSMNEANACAAAGIGQPDRLRAISV